jgi:hypothetical protein
MHAPTFDPCILVSRHAGRERGAAEAEGTLLSQMGALYCWCVACLFLARGTCMCKHIAAAYSRPYQHEAVDLYPQSALVTAHAKHFAYTNTYTHTYTLKLICA